MSETTEKTASHLVTSENRAEYMDRQLAIRFPQPVEAKVEEKAPPDVAKPVENVTEITEEEQKAAETKQAADEQAAKEAQAKQDREARQAAEQEVQRLRAKYEPPKPVDRPKPEPDQFENAVEYGKALEEYTADRVAAELHQQTHIETLKKAWIERETATKAEITDYDQIMAATTIQVSNELAQAIRESELGPKMAYFLAKNPNEAIRLGNLPTRQMLREFGQLEAKVGAKEAKAPEKTKLATLSKAPPPETPVKGAGVAGPNVDSEGVYHGTYTEWKAGRRAGTIH